MRVKDFLTGVAPSTQVTFIKARARKDAHTPFYHEEYQTTPIRRACDWDGGILDYIILNDSQPPIDWLSGSNWKGQFDKGMLKSLLIVSADDFELLMPDEKQRKSTIRFIEQKINDRRTSIGQ